jgi:general secretion pathway protein K
MNRPRVPSPSTPRRGVALIAALWLIVVIATVALQFSIEAKERRALGIDAAERGVGRAAASGALALVQSRLDRALREMGQGNARIARLRASDPWLDVDSLYSGPVVVDSTVTVDVRARDLGTQLNINQISEDEFRTFFGFVLNDYTLADKLAQSIMDWRDADDMPRVNGGERDEYIKKGQLALPANSTFREVDELRLVQGMTPAVFALVAPYLTTHGTGTVNLNTAPAPVLRALPGMTDAILNQILGLRSQGQRIQSVAQVLGAAMGRGRQSPAQLQAMQVETQRLTARATVETQQVELTLMARSGPQAQPARLTAIVQRNGTAAAVSWRQW